MRTKTPKISLSVLSSKAYAKLPTERSNPRTRGIDLKSSLAIVRLIIDEDRRVPAAVEKTAREIARGVDLLAACLAAGKKILIVGAGTSGRLATLEAAECPPTFNTRPSQIRAVMAGGARAVFRAVEGAEDNAHLGRRAVADVGRGDVVIGVAASGVTPFVRAALRAGAGRGAKTILITSNGRAKNMRADIVIASLVGPEVVAGSTRLKAGSAAKLTLNALTTGAMIRNGKVYDHWMVDLKPTSRKLRLRGERMVADLGRVGPARARALLAAARGSVKAAILMGRKRVGLQDALVLLKNAGGALRKALGEQ